MLILPQEFIDRVRSTFAPSGAGWLATLPERIATYAERWEVRIGAPFADLSYNLALQATCADGTAAVLKLGVPCAELRTEIAALTLYGGNGAVKLLAADGQGGALLLERLLPGTPLRDLGDDDAATVIAADVMQRLRPAPPPLHSFPSVTDWFNGLTRLRAEFDGGYGPFPAQMVARAEALYSELTASAADPIVLHGDLHHTNILRSERDGWLAIDPKGVIGEPAYEVGALLRNPLSLPEWPDLRRRLDRRADILCERLGLERRRVLGWAAAQMVLSAWWSYEDGGPGADWRRWLSVAEVLFGLAGDR
ncbi:MAG: phosphotransferase [Oscillochloris sp.]|nr:phosphotransferase [Oscillochloris sp.]